MANLASPTHLSEEWRGNMSAPGTALKVPNYCDWALLGTAIAPLRGAPSFPP